MTTPRKKEVVRMLTRESILSASDIVTETVHIPEWNGSVIVRGLSGAERDGWEDSILQYRKGGKRREVNLRNLRAKLVAVSTYDQEGNRLFSDSDIEALGTKSAAALQRIFKVAQELSGLSDDEVEQLTEEMGNDQSGSSGTS